ncbi:dual specificity protein phosphatase 12-like [Prunus avium]|uniref:protein-tyrosine-phosphatase n=1 Tax=Prunus avium TaxID=42229 RepID=A0A6P5TUW1_PRUAV|nr:dual specificity protein phosphatase 12-like [Prunus avium]
MPYLVRENLFLGNIGDAAEVIRNGSKEITHILCAIPTKEIKVYAGGSVGGSASVGDGSISFRAGKDLKLVRMGVPLRDMDDENLLDYLDACVDFIDNGRKKGSVLVHCLAGVSRSASIITTYLMRTEHLSQEGVNKSLLVLSIASLRI